jgi:hypothetical protein
VGVRRVPVRLYATCWLLFLALASPTCSHPDGVVLQEGGYSVVMPGPTTLTEKRLDLAYLRFHATKAGSLAYMVGYSDNLGVDLSPTELLDGIQSGYVGDDTLVQQDVIELNGVPGRELIIQGRGITRVLRLYARGQRAYHLTVLTKDSELPPEEVTRFFATFSIAGD